MKLLISLCCLLFITAAFQPKPGEKALLTVRVAGTCNMCKDRIEDALDVKGVRSASWNQKSRILMVSYFPDKISADSIETLVANVGHDTDHKTAPAEKYSALPECCLYRK